MAFVNNMGENSFSNSKNVNEESKFIPKTVSDIVKNVSMVSESELDSHIHSYENELRKVDAYKRLLEDDIEKLNEKRLHCKDREREAIIKKKDQRAKKSADMSEKKSWGSSFQLWTTPVEYDNDQEYFSLGGAFVPSKKGSTSAGVTIKDISSELEDDEAKVVEDEEAMNGGLFRAPQPHEQQKKKRRRCWSPSLHEPFVHAVNSLGGAEAATPKTILEIMRVEGLTSDEVKSHLQKYRLHTRRLAKESSARLVMNSSWLANQEVSGNNNGNNNVQENEFDGFENWGKQVDRRF
ncbi:hypothetical protein CASFOL_011424 [Castilleja foliolosa]|uniref:HTH myb-type domain-containing protein n=1 Tax=Castilleja foliolosa TaxID=1961234 RepID=A0ABD3DWF7_9LAMI